MQKTLLEFDSSAFVNNDGFLFIRERIMKMKPSLAGVRITHGGFDAELIPGHVIGSLDAARAIAKSWIANFLSEWQRTHYTKEMLAIHSYIGMLSMYGVQSPRTRVDAVRRVIEEIAARVLALSCGMAAVPIRERVQRIQTSGAYDHTATAQAFSRSEERVPYLILGELLPVGRMRNSIGMHLDDEKLSAILQVHVRADRLERWPDVRRELITCRPTNRAPMPMSVLLLIEAHRMVRKLQNFQASISAGRLA